MKPFEKLSPFAFFVFLFAFALPPTLAQSRERINRIIETLQQGKPIFGISPQDLSLTNAAVLADSPLDFITIDMEHGALDFERLQQFLQGMLSRQEPLENSSLRPNVVPTLAIPSNGREQLQFLVKQALDLGAYGVMFPHINTPEDALAAVRAARYPQERGAPDFDPPGLRGVSPLIALRYWGLSLKEYVKRADIWPLDPGGEIILFLQIEEAEGVKNLEAILDVPGVSSVFIGPLDLATSMGFPADPSAPEVQQAMRKILATCKKKGIPCGVPANAETIEQRIEEGYKIFILDSGELRADAAAALRRVKKY
ncbi:aldolase/citrate lyase family protein [Acidobacteria bacterium AH-259-G07]|nr:aldolase/citrate lyase family protein [Acidobacteria bacterium AH-259-G07]